MRFKTGRKILASVILAFVLLLSSVFPAFAASAPAIKTQKAADAIEGGVRGIDVSKYQGTINWKRVAADGVEFAFIRASIGNVLRSGYVLNPDDYFEYNVEQASRYGIKVGAYHHACLGDEKNTRAEAEAFLYQLSKVEVDYPVVIDIEINPARLSRSELTRLTKYFADIVSDEGYQVMIYSYQNFVRDNLDVDRLGNYKLWLANYLEPPKYISHSIWQHTNQGRVDGIAGPVDINIAYPNLKEQKFQNTSVNKRYSDYIKDILNEYYDADLPSTGTKGVHEAINAAVQTELNKQLDADVDVNGRFNDECQRLLASIPFGGGTQGRITFMLQAKLFYHGFYKAAPSSKFDGRTTEALRDLQYSRGLEVTGAVNRETIAELFS